MWLADALFALEKNCRLKGSDFSFLARRIGTSSPTSTLIFVLFSYTCSQNARLISGHCVRSLCRGCFCSTDACSNCGRATFVCRESPASSCFLLIEPNSQYGLAMCLTPIQDACDSAAIETVGCGETDYACHCAKSDQIKALLLPCLQKNSNCTSSELQSRYFLMR